MILLKWRIDYVILTLIIRVQKGDPMHIRRKDEFRVSFSTIFSGFLLGLAFVPLTIFITVIPYYSYFAIPVYLILLAFFLLILVIYFVLSIHLCRKKRYTTLYFSGIFSVAFSVLAALIFTFAYPYLHQSIYLGLIELSEFLVNAKRFSMVPADGHYLIGLSAMLPGIITGILLLFAYFRKKRIRDAEYRQPKKKNYYYF